MKGGILTIILLERTPYKIVRRMGTRVHRRNYNDRYDSSYNDEEHAAVLRIRDEFVPKNDEECRDPKNANVCEVDVPSVWNVRILMIKCVHLDENVGCDLDQGCQVKHPTVKINPSREEANGPSPVRASRDGRPMIDTTGSRDRRSKLGVGQYHLIQVIRLYNIGPTYLGQTQTNEGIPEDGDDKAIDKAWRSSID